MNYFTKSDDNTNIPVHLESVSPTGKYFVGWHSESRETIYLYRTLYKTDDVVYGEPIKQCSGSDDVGAGLNGVVWYEEYGFVKIIFRIWCTMNSESVRLYFDRELYEKKKKELHEGRA
ncbi:MAG: hypothetical protein NC485_13480 [Ruminococcus flavefaciens]|nr:hypothetical protein [Ruminococcus flavefaciens]